MFVLTSGGSVNYEGTQHFINNLEPSIQDNLQYVLCLDALAGAESLDLHVSRFPKENEENALKLYKVDIILNIIDF